LDGNGGKYDDGLTKGGQCGCWCGVGGGPAVKEYVPCMFPLGQRLGVHT